MVRTRGSAPSRLTGNLPVSSPESPWWDQVASEITSRPGMVGRTMTIEELTGEVPCYPDGRAPRPRTVARRLWRILELVERGSNGSLGRGATYRIVGSLRAMAVGRQDVADETVTPDNDWLMAAVERMTKGK